MEQSDHSWPTRTGKAASLLRALGVLAIMLGILVAAHYGVIWRLGMPG